MVAKEATRCVCSISIVQYGLSIIDMITTRIKPIVGIIANPLQD